VKIPSVLLQIFLVALIVKSSMTSKVLIIQWQLWKMKFGSPWRRQIAWPLLEKHCFDFRWTKHVIGAETVWYCCINKILWGWWSVLGMTAAYGKQVRQDFDAGWYVLYAWACSVGNLTKELRRKTLLITECVVSFNSCRFCILNNWGIVCSYGSLYDALKWFRMVMLVMRKGMEALDAGGSV